MIFAPMRMTQTCARNEAQLEGTARSTCPATTVAATTHRRDGAVAPLLANPTASLPRRGRGDRRGGTYRRSCRWTLKEATTIRGVGADPFGTYAAGGVSFLFSDMLGNHTLGTSAQVTSRFDEFGGSVFYLNRKRRWNWGVGLDQTPYVSRGYQTGVIVAPDGQQFYQQDEYRILQVDRSLSGIISYPFSRAARVEVSGGLRQIGLKQDVRSQTFDFQTGQLVAQEEREIASFDNLNLGQGSAALVYDTSIFGATSPIRGSRSRLEVSQSSGSLSYTGALADLRTYVMPFRPVTSRSRMFYGATRDAENERLPNMVPRLTGMVRGYDRARSGGGEG